MADLYKIEIVDLAADEITAKIYLDNTQSSDLPAKKNIALQIMTDAFEHMTEKLWRDSFNISEVEIETLLQKADSAKLALYNSYIHGEEENYEQYITIAAQEIIAVKIIKSEHWDTASQWVEELNKHDHTTIPTLVDTFWVKVKNPNLLKHLKVGLIWTTPMFDRTEVWTLNTKRQD